MKKNISYTLTFIIIELAIVLRNTFDKFINFFWFCDFSSLFIAIGFYYKKHHFVRGMLNIILLPQILYMIGFITQTIILPNIQQVHPFIAEFYILRYADKEPWFLITAITLHLSGLLVWYFLRGEKPQKESLKQSLIILTIAYITMAAFTNPANNINYAFTISQNLLIGALWIPATFIIVVLPTYYLQVWVYNTWFKKKTTTH